MKVFCYIAFIFLLSSSFTEAADNSSTTLSAQLQGVYKSHFMNSLVSGEEYQSEDIVEIVPFEESNIYIRAHLEFFNGHECSIWGIAKYKDGMFVYHDPTPSMDESPSCTLKVSVSGKKLMLSDIDNATGRSTCSMYCGARGSFSNYAIARSSKKNIRYLKRLMTSPQYLESIDAFKKVQSLTYHSSGTG
jgi:hypothetical protein